MVDAGQQEEARLKAGRDEVIGATEHVGRVFQLTTEHGDAAHVLEVLGLGPARRTAQDHARVALGVIAGQ